ncbi:hypothetical protein [Magnetovibrio blakemorei]|uniref:Nicotinamide riboside transporter PnuC n=1 Tax=Magnetovibrio blakemorei TaxID=28181 RepID=A0A1E5Q2Z1_9PROT|nr:hypothetical protein [Magnetovibrio blakemorei]OEJ63861.1 hypothetical protein BEN30_17045 [Magnetovibrio blakemorei]
MPPFISIAKWTGTLFGVTGAALVALNLPVSGWGFVLFLVSSVSWAIAGVVMHERSLLLLNAVFIIINLLGIYRWLIA